MLDFVTNRRDIESELIDEIKLFFPYLDDCSYKIVHEYERIEQGGEFSIKNSVIIDENKFLSSEILPAGMSEIEFRRRDKFACKSAIFDAMSKVSGNVPPWGSLTGIRPSKLIYDMLEDGLTLYECEKRLEKNYRVSTEKSKLICDIVKNQESFYVRDPRLFNLYIHIPFCTSRCSYCSFITGLVSRYEKIIPEYVEKLRVEIKDSVDFVRKNGKLYSVYVGGGTPTAISATDLTKLLHGFGFENVEFTVEAGRPDTITREKLDALDELGVNRICINPQTLNAETLKLIGRNHSAADFFYKYELARRYNFDINVDLIAGLERETTKDFQKTLNAVIDLVPDNVTVHTLSRKNGSALKESGRYYNDDVPEMVRLAFSRLTKSGYLPYYLYRQKQMLGNLENVGYALPGKQCANNVTTMEECLSVIACGAGAITKAVTDGERRIERLVNLRDVELYLQEFDKKLQTKRNFLQKQFTKVY